MLGRLPVAAVGCWVMFCADAQSVAVLPFTNATALTVPQSNSLDWIGESIAWNIRDAFTAKGIVSLDHEVIEDAYHTLRLKPFAPLTSASVLKLGQSLDAEQVIYGSFTFTPAPSAADDTKGSLRISARVIDRRKLRELPELTEEGRLEDLARLEVHLAWQGLSRVSSKLAPPESDYASLRAPIRLDAEEIYVRGVLARGDDREKLFRQAATLDPRFTQPSFALGKMLYQRKQFAEASTWLQKVQPADLRYREATFFLGLVRYELADFAGAQKAFQTIAAVLPLSEVWNDLAASESRRNLPQAAENFRKALDGDPNDPDYHFNLGYALWKRGDFLNAADRFRAVLDRSPGDQMATLLLGRCLQKQGLRLGDTKGPDARLQSLERLKVNYEEKAYRQLKSVLESKEE